MPYLHKLAIPSQRVTYRKRNITCSPATNRLTIPMEISAPQLADARRMGRGSPCKVDATVKVSGVAVASKSKRGLREV